MTRYAIAAAAAAILLAIPTGPTHAQDGANKRRDKRDEKREKKRERDAGRDAAQAEQQAKKLLGQAEKMAARDPEKARKALEELLERYALTDFAKENADTIDELAVKLRTATYADADRFHGAPVVPAAGRLRLTYTFDRVAELGDFDVRKGAKPKVEKGHLSGVRRDEVIRHVVAAAFESKASWEVRGRGFGSLFVVLEGQETDWNDDVVRLEVTTAAGSIELRLVRGGDADSVEAKGERDPRFERETPWSVKIERTEGGGLRAVAIGSDGSETGTVVEAAADELTPTSKVDPRLGLSFRSGAITIDRLVVEGPIPDARGAAAADGKLPKGRWVPLDEQELAGFEAKGSFVWQNGTIVEQKSNGTLTPKLLLGHPLRSYTFSIKVYVQQTKAYARKRAAKHTYLSISLPVDGADATLEWVFTRQQMRLEGTEARFLERLVEGEWYELVAKVDEDRVEAFVNGKRAFAVPLSEVGNARRKSKRRGELEIRTSRGVELLVFKDPKIKVD